VQLLYAGETLVDSLTFTATDGSVQQVTITIHGTDDAPIEIPDPVDEPVDEPDEPSAEEENEDPGVTEEPTLEGDAEEPVDQTQPTTPLHRAQASDQPVVATDTLVPAEDKEATESQSGPIEQPETESARSRRGYASSEHRADDLGYVYDFFGGLHGLDYEMSESGEVAVINWDRFWEAVDTIEDDLAQEANLQVMVGSATVVTTAVSAAYLMWSLRGASLIAGLVTSLPAWTMIDPLPILEVAAGNRAGQPFSKDEEETLQDIVDKPKETGNQKEEE